MTACHGASPGRSLRTTELLSTCRSQAPLRLRNTQIQMMPNPFLPSIVTKVSRATVKHYVRRSGIFSQSKRVRLTVSTERLSILTMQASQQWTEFRRHSAGQRPDLLPILEQYMETFMLA